jgi:hypothetical protein
LLVEALHDGGNSPAAVGEIYRLSARAAVVLEQRDLAEQYYRRWLAIDPDAALPGDAAPKLREPFVAAQAYIAAHGRLLARVHRTEGALVVELIADPLAMARAAAVVDPGRPPDARSPAIPFGDDHHARLAAGSRAAILDEDGNRLLELDATAPPPGAAATAAVPAAVSTSPPAPEARPWTRRWLTWVIPTGVFVLGGAGFGVAALASYDRARMITDASGQAFLSDAEANTRRGRTFAWISAAGGGLAIGCAIPTAIFGLQQLREARHVVVPTGGDGRIGLAVVGRF